MNKSGIIFTALLLFLALSVGVTDSKAQVELVENGSFETGDFTGWSMLNLSGDGTWLVYTGTIVDVFPVLPPPDGNFAAVTSQDSPDSNILYQDITIVPGTIVTCTAIVYLENRGEGEGSNYIIGDGLTLNAPNQQMRVDIMDPDADPFDTGAGVLQNLFQTLPGDPNSIGYTTLNFDLTPFAGTTVRFRAAVVVTRNVLNGAVDAVSCIAEGGVANVPTLSEWGMIAAAGGLGMIGVFFAVKRKRVNIG